MKHVTALIIALTTVAALCGCATQYQPRSFEGGFEETALAPNAFQVRFSGNGYTDPQLAADFALLRSAEVTLEHGFSYFVIVDARSTTRTESYTMPTTATTTAQATAYGNTAYGTATTTYYGGQTLVFQKPSSSNTIMCFKESPDVGGLVYDAAFLADSMRRKHGLGAAAHRTSSYAPGPSQGDPVMSYVCGSMACADPRIPKIRELVAQGKSIEDAYAEATAAAGKE